MSGDLTLRFLGYRYSALGAFTTGIPAFFCPRSMGDKFCFWWVFMDFIFVDEIGRISAFRECRKQRLKVLGSPLVACHYF